mmetsp:Transcript_23089/g.54519  ORF Transcript_23089/g.54519 Transcript_23089/m.54519 type:complete len:579 (+) Transcript_23089:284-2020(+)
MCRPSDVSGKVFEEEPNNFHGEQQKRLSDDVTFTTTIAVGATYIGGYILGANDMDFSVTILIGSSGLLLLAIYMNFYELKRRFAPFFRWVKEKTSYSSMSLGRMASKSSGTALSTLSRVTSVDAIKSISKQLLCSALQSITRKECFTRLDYIERLSINDVSILFRYAGEANVEGFVKKQFLDDQNEIVRAVITAIDMAVNVSRGSLSEETKLVSKRERTEGDMDALRFVAVTRIFAEWRTLRMVPKGYQRYTVGLSLAYRDVLQNLEKIERGVHVYLKQGQASRKSPPTSPTLRELLQFERRTNVHAKLPRLKDRSAASGLLWTKRQLHYQTTLLGNSLEVPECYPHPRDAATAAYQIVYNEYHGWAVKHMFIHSFGGSPPLEKIWLSMSPPMDLPKNHVGGNRKYATKRPRDFPPPCQELSDTSGKSSSESSGIREDENEVLAALHNFRHEIIEKWEDLVRMFNCGKEEKKKMKRSLILSSESHFDLNQFNTEMVNASLRSSPSDTSDMNSVVTSSTVASCSSSSTVEVAVSRQLYKDELIEKSKREVEDFVRNVSPMVADLGKLMDEMNMNDPTRA